MESLLASADNDQLLPQADFRLSGPTASYVVDRQEVTYFSSVTEVSPSAVRVATWNVNSDNFIDLQSLHFSFEVHNIDTAKPLEFAAPTPHVLFGRMIITVGRVTMESLDGLTTN